MNEQHFIETIETHQKIIYKVCRLYRNSIEDQEDLFQDIVYQLWKSFPSYRNDSKISTWMYQIALNTALASFRKKKIAIDYQRDFSQIHQEVKPNEQTEKEELMYWALRQLNETEKALISLYLEDYSYEEIATIVGITENYVGVKINRIKKKLKNILNK